MGMYNEVFKKCPHCKDGVGYVQIGQIVLGFGGFDLDRPDSLDELTVDQLKDLKEVLKNEYFNCRTPSHRQFCLTSLDVEDDSDCDVCGGVFIHFNGLDYPDLTERERLLIELEKGL